MSGIRIYSTRKQLIMRVLFIARSTLFTEKGGDTVQITRTAQCLQHAGIHVDIRLTHEKIDYTAYSLLHFFNIIRPADIVYHVRKACKPFVVSPILVDYSEHDKHYRTGISGWLFRYLHRDAIEYIKTIARWLLGKDILKSKSYLWKGHRRSIQYILRQAAMVLPNSMLEYKRLTACYQLHPGYTIVPNGVDTDLFAYGEAIQKDPRLVVSVARVEGIKNQLNLVRALNNTPFRLLLIGSPAVNQKKYYNACRHIASDNVSFIDHLPQEALIPYYQKAKVHILPSWFETCGLSSLEAGVMGCNLVITSKGYTSEYFGNDAIYCDPANPASILEAVEKAADRECDVSLRNNILSNYTWQQAAAQTAAAYRQVLHTI
jgi:glycosyltransferase involved in cell wall biosynthesis